MRLPRFLQRLLPGRKQLALPAPSPEPAPQWPPAPLPPRVEVSTPTAPAPPPWMRPRSHIIVFANEKGGVGKSTTAFHTCIALCNAGEKVAALDVDLRQLTLDRALNARQETARDYGVTLPGPQPIILVQSTEAELEQKVRMAQIECGFVVIDVGGHDSPIARRAIAIADTIVTPVNDSFIDLDMLGRIDPRTGELKTLGAFARLVAHLREPGVGQRARALDWVVMQNRQRSLMTRNERKVRDALNAIAPVAGFRLVAGLSERVSYRELFPMGLTLFDLGTVPDMGKPQPAARAEIGRMIAALDLPGQAKQDAAP